MELKVNHRELNNVSKKSENNADLLDEELDKLVNSVNELREIWQGKDSDEYCDRVYSYLKDLRIVPEIYRTIGNFIESTDKNYKDIDEEYSNELKKVVS